MAEVYDGRLTSTWATSAELRACAVWILRHDPFAKTPDQQLEAMQVRLRARRLWYRYSADLEAALRHARRYV